MRPLALAFAAAWALAGPAGAPTQVLRERATLRVPANLWDRFGGVERLALGPDGGTLAALDWAGPNGEPLVEVVDVATGRRSAQRTPPGAWFLGLAFAADGRLLVLGASEDKAVKVWEVVPPRGGGG